MQFWHSLRRNSPVVQIIGSCYMNCKQKKNPPEGRSPFAHFFATLHAINLRQQCSLHLFQNYKMNQSFCICFWSKLRMTGDVSQITCYPVHAVYYLAACICCIQRYGVGKWPDLNSRGMACIGWERRAWRHRHPANVVWQGDLTSVHNVSSA
jgi:hypothetical protein